MQERFTVPKNKFMGPVISACRSASSDVDSLVAENHRLPGTVARQACELQKKDEGMMKWEHHITKEVEKRLKESENKQKEREDNLKKYEEESKEME